MEKIDKFNKYETIFIKIHLITLGLGMFLLMLAFLAVDSIESIARTFLGVVYVLLYVVIINFFIALIRLFKYLIVFRKSDKLPTIKRTIIIILTSPISLGIYFILTLIMSLSLASCTIQ